MKLLIMKKLVIASIALLAVPAAVLAQKENKDKDKDKDNNELQTITIMRTADTKNKTVIEIDGDKIKINGKDASENKDVQVNVNTIKGARVRTWNNRGSNFSFDTNKMTLFGENENRAFLGVVTEGNDKGAEIQSVTEESAAEKAGLKEGDIITNIDDKEVKGTDDVTRTIRENRDKYTFNFKVLRDGKTQNIEVKMPRKLKTADL